MTPTTRGEWANALAEWIGRRSIAQAASESGFGRHSLQNWLQYCVVPRKAETRQRIRDITGINLEPLWASEADERSEKSRNHTTNPFAAMARSMEAERKRAEQALRDSGGYGPHDLTEALEKRKAARRRAA